MPKRKKLPVVPDYVGLGEVEKLIVQKSNPLQSLARMNLVDHSVTNCPYYYAPVIVSYYN